jgi:uncharacterized protein (DUF2236 family)
VSASTTLVTRDDLEAGLARLRATVRDPRAGVFGPGSRTWAISREAVVFLGGGRAALLQLAHPFVAHAVDQHSTARADPVGRFQRTFEHVFAMLYGDLDAAIASARRVHAIHRRVTGELTEDVGSWRRGAAYAANEPEALLWVHATLLDTTIQVHELMHGPLPAAAKAAYYEETKRFGELFGIPPAIVPPDWPAFEAYVARTLASPELTVGEPARAIAHALLRPAGSWIGPVWTWYAAVTARLLPPRQRREFALPWGPREAALAAATLGAFRVGLPLLPPRLRWLPAYVDACRRVEGRPPDVLARAVDWLRRARGA